MSWPGHLMQVLCAHSTFRCPKFPKGFLRAVGQGSHAARVELDWTAQRHFFPKTTCSAPSRSRGWSWISKRSSPGFPSPVWGFLPYSANSLQRSWKGLHCLGKILSQWDFYTDVISFIFRGVIPTHTTPLSCTRGESGPALGKSTVGTSHLRCSVCGCLFQNDTETFQEGSEEISLIRFWFLMWLLQCYTWAYAVPVRANGLRAFCPL